MIFITTKRRRCVVAKQMKQNQRNITKDNIQFLSNRFTIILMQKILIIDDEREITEIIQEVFLDNGYQVTVANTVNEALCFFKNTNLRHYSFRLSLMQS